MFSTRLRVVLIGIAVLLLGLFARAVQVQWGQHAQWEEQAQKRMQQVATMDTSRGRILDYKGRELAVDAPCIDAVVDYRAILRPPNEKWVREVARERLRRRLGSDYFQAEREQQRELIDEQIQQVKQDIRDMWETLGDEKLTGQNHEQIEDRRQQIVRKVQMQRRYIMYAKYAIAEQKNGDKEPAWWERWLVEEPASESMDSFDVTTGDETQSHVVLPAVSTDLGNYLGKNADRFPGLAMRPGQHRAYPFGTAACQVIGNLAAVNGEDLKSDPDKGNGLREYRPTDVTGRQGIEAMCESVLRGTRGRWHRDTGQQAKIDSMPKPGTDVRLSIDIELQKKAEAAFLQRKLPTGEMDTTVLHGAAILIDVPTGQVRAMASYPTYDINTLVQEYGRLVADDINRPLFNRATMAQLEPGSTVKPMVGMAGISEKVVGVHEGIECDGHLKLNGITFQQFGRCWSIRVPGGMPHHQFGPSPHHGIYGNPDGFLCYADALERSCNVWPETVADRLGMDRLKKWFGLFGLGRPTGIGLPEASGKLPQAPRGPVAMQRSATWFAGIGQGIGATPIQMANVAATIARDGTWIRPTVVAGGYEAPGAGERVDLPIDKEALKEARRGMVNVVKVVGATGGKALRREDVQVAGKTGSAQAAKFSVVVRDDDGKPVMENGRPKRRFVEPSTSKWTNPEAPWYRATGADDSELSHAWFIGFAPADHPQVAFAVMVEYGGSGGAVAGPIANALLDAAIEEGYLATANPKP